MMVDKELANVEPAADQRQQLQQVYREMLAANLASEVSEAEFLSAVRSQPDILQALRREIFADHRRALLIGLGAIDRSIAAVSSREYGLFAVRNSGSVDDSPLAIAALPNYSGDDDRLRASQFLVRPRPVGQHLSWQFEETRVTASSVYAFNVYRAIGDSQSFERIGPDGGVSAPRGPEGEVRQFDFMDRSADPTATYSYAIAPLNAFGTELATRTLSSVDPVVSNQAIEIGEISLGTDDDGAVVVSWELPDEALDPAFSMYVERNEFPSVDAEDISGSLNVSTQSFTDNDAKTHGTVYGYRVTVVDDADLEWTSPLKSLLFSNLARPEVPVDVSAECLSLGGRRLIQLQWNPPESPSPISNEEIRYTIYADKSVQGQVQRQASASPVQGNEYTLEVASQESRDYTVGVAARSRDGLEGPRAEATCFVRGRLPAAVESVSLPGNQPAQTVTVAWEYRQDRGIRGFRVVAGDRIVADERDLGPDARSFAMDEPESSVQLDVVAVSIDGQQSRARGVVFEATAIEPDAIDEPLPDDLIEEL